MLNKTVVAVLLLVCAVPVQAQITEETVGDPDSFGRAQTYLGLAQATVYIEPDCSLLRPEATPCVDLAPAPAVTNVDEADLASIVLPGKATNSLICFTFTPFATWQWDNTTGSTQTGQMFLRPAVRVESSVLEDPGLIDPNTGLPFDGVLFDSTISTFLQTRTLDPGESDLEYRAMTRACTGGLVSTRVLRDSYGLSEALIKDFFKNPITLSFGVRGNVAMMADVSYSVGIRLYGD